MKTIRIFAMFAAIVATCSAYSNDIDFKKYIGKQSGDYCYRPDTFALEEESYCVAPYTCTSFEETALDENRVSEVVSSMVAFPLLNEQKIEGMVLVEYHVDYDGKVVVDQMNTSNPELGSYVKMQIEKVFLRSKSGPEKKYYARFNFEVL